MHASLPNAVSGAAWSASRPPRHPLAACASASTTSLTAPAADGDQQQPTRQPCLCCVRIGSSCIVREPTLYSRPSRGRG
jgi:hypothetical protein